MKLEVVNCGLEGVKKRVVDSFYVCGYVFEDQPFGFLIQNEKIILYFRMIVS